jgi:hypothetical protein
MMFAGGHGFNGPVPKLQLSLGIFHTWASRRASGEGMCDVAPVQNFPTETDPVTAIPRTGPQAGDTVHAAPDPARL